MLKNFSFILFTSVLLSTTAQAAIVFTPSLSYLEQKVTDENNVTNKGKMVVVDVRLGYVTDFGLYIGGLYSIQDQELLTEASDSFFGPSIGYSKGNFLFVGTYYVYGERDLTNGVGKYSGVSGFQLDLTYAIPVYENFSVGPQLTYYSVKFDEVQNSGISSSSDYKTSGITPAVNFTVTFN